MARSDITLTMDDGHSPAVSVAPAGCSVYDLFAAFERFATITTGTPFMLIEQEQGYAFVEEKNFYAASEPVDFDAAFEVLEEAGLLTGPVEGPKAETFAVGDLVELVDNFAGEYTKGYRFTIASFDDDGDILNTEGAFFFAEELRKVTETPQVPRDIRTGLAIPAPGFPWTDTKGPVSLKEPAELTVADFSVGDKVSVSRKHWHFAEGTETTVIRTTDLDVWVVDTISEYPNGVCMGPDSLRKVTEEPAKPSTEFKQGDLVKVVRVTHEDDRAVLDQVGDVIGVDPTHTNGQTVHATFWDLDKGEDKLWWVHKDSLDLVYRPGSSS